MEEFWGESDEEIEYVNITHILNIQKII